MYLDNHVRDFAPINKLMVASDPSSYSGEKSLVAIVYSWELKRACYCPVQVISASTLVSPNDIDMTDRLRALCMSRKLERTSAYREWQALSHALAQTTGKDLATFRIPTTVSWAPVGPGEVRLLDTRDSGVNVARIFHRETKEPWQPKRYLQCCYSNGALLWGFN